MPILPVSRIVTRAHRAHPKRHAAAWKANSLTERRPIDCPGHCHDGHLYHGDPADPNTKVEACPECDGGRLKYYRNAMGEMEVSL